MSRQAELGQKGQSSLELVLVAVAVLALVVLVTSAYITATDSTSAVAIVKASMLQKLSAYDKLYVIQKLDCSEQYASGFLLNCDAYVSPNDLSATEQADISSFIDAKLAAKTKYKNLNLTFK